MAAQYPDWYLSPISSVMITLLGNFWLIKRKKAPRGTGIGRAGRVPRRPVIARVRPKPRKLETLMIVYPWKSG